jgi:hypothetical protein
VDAELGARVALGLGGQLDEPVSPADAEPAADAA